MPSYTWKRGHSEPGGGGESYEWTETWVVTDYVQQNDEVGWIELLADFPDLAKGQPHSLVPGAYVDDFQADRIGTSEGWEVKVRYKLDPTDSPDVSPLDRPAEIEVESESEPVPVLTWNDGTVIRNTAGEPIIGEVRDDPRALVTVTKNVEQIPAFVFAYNGAINSDTVVIGTQTCDPRTLKFKTVRQPKREVEYVNGQPVYFYTLTYSLVYNPNTWIRKILNRGLYAIRDSSASSSSGSSGSGRKYRIKIDGEPVDEPQFLDENGHWLPNPEPDQIYWLEGYVDPELPFSELPLS